MSARHVVNHSGNSSKSNDRSNKRTRHHEAKNAENVEDFLHGETPDKKKSPRALQEPGGAAGLCEKPSSVSYSSELEFATNLQVDAGVIVIRNEGQLGVARAKAIASLAADAVIRLHQCQEF